MVDLKKQTQFLVILLKWACICVTKASREAVSEVDCNLAILILSSYCSKIDFVEYIKNTEQIFHEHYVFWI